MGFYSGSRIHEPISPEDGAVSTRQLRRVRTYITHRPTNRASLTVTMGDSGGGLYLKIDGLLLRYATSAGRLHVTVPLR